MAWGRKRVAWQLISTEYTLVASVSRSELVPGSPWLRSTTFPHKVSSAQEFIEHQTHPSQGRKGLQSTREDARCVLSVGQSEGTKGL